MQITMAFRHFVDMWALVMIVSSFIWNVSYPNATCHPRSPLSPAQPPRAIKWAVSLSGHDRGKRARQWPRAFLIRFCFLLQKET